MRASSGLLLLVFCVTANAATADRALKARKAARADVRPVVTEVSSEPVSRLQQAVRLLKSGRVAETRKLLRTEVEEHPENLDARRMLVQLLVDAGFAMEAETLLVKGQSLSPQSLDIARSLAGLQIQRGALRAALDTLQQSGRFAASDAEYKVSMAVLCQQLQKHDEAVALFEEALALVPGKAEWFYALWVSRVALGDREGARHSAEAALANGLQSAEQVRVLKAALRRDVTTD